MKYFPFRCPTQWLKADVDLMSARRAEIEGEIGRIPNDSWLQMLRFMSLYANPGVYVIYSMDDLTEYYHSMHDDSLLAEGFAGFNLMSPWLMIMKPDKPATEAHMMLHGTLFEALSLQKESQDLLVTHPDFERLGNWSKVREICRKAAAWQLAAREANPIIPDMHIHYGMSIEEKAMTAGADIGEGFIEKEGVPPCS